MVATWSALEKKHATICFTTLFDRLNFTGGASPGKTHTSNMLLCFGIVLKDPRFVGSYNVPDATRSSTVEFLQLMCAPFDLTYPLLFSQVVRDPTGATFRDAEMIMENLVHISRRNAQCILCLFMCYSGVFLDQRLRF